MVAAASAAALIAAAAPQANAQPEDLSSRIPLYIDGLGRPTPLAVEAVYAFAAQPGVPPEVADALRAGIDFFAGNGEPGGPPLPEDAPAIAQFAWPTISRDCIGPGLHSTASAIAAPGPTEIPAPGAGPGQVAFAFTALGTPAAAAEQGEMNVYWVNVENLRAGVTALGNNGINPTGPTTLSGTADTGPGFVLAVAAGRVHTEARACGFAPTAAAFHVH
ncbi:hypothetical protein C3E79_04155 [Corynebacterium liangguodongii]|uniref:Uncharacterized protein n=2 Tax=Corynebacterium liangguodongii TaxID=2079535 RepID=A0A2S0WH32_9CORY|nr:hypothetical protein C3E79_04155 [Corynebacterium liangguodongii]PWB98661.1 hypothetical protein DF219_10790 [Corynebacterium liangguodongii]